MVEVPLEVCAQIFSLLETRDLKTVCLASSHYWELARQRMWAEPKLNQFVRGPKGLGIKELKELSRLEVPIKRLKFTQFPRINTGRDEKEIRVMVDLLQDRFDLQSFVIDARPYRGNNIDYNLDLKVSHLKYLLKLPITSLNTAACPSMGPMDFINTLRELDNCPDIIINPGFHYCLTIKHWRRMRHLPVREIHPYFNECINSKLKKEHLEEYDLIVSQLRPQPKFVLKDHNGRLETDVLSKIKRTKIAEMHFGSRCRNYRGILDYIGALIENNQNPHLFFPEHNFLFDGVPVGVSLSDLNLYFCFPIAELCTGCLQIDEETVDKFVELISTRHAKTPIKKFKMNRNQKIFKPVHIESFRSAGLIS